MENSMVIGDSYSDWDAQATTFDLEAVVAEAETQACGCCYKASRNLTRCEVGAGLYADLCADCVAVLPTLNIEGIDTYSINF